MPLPRLGGLGAGLGGLATVLGLGLEGYAKDQATRVERERNRLKDISDAQMLKVSMEEHQANTASRQAATKLAENKALIEQRAFTQLKQDFPDHPDVAGDYIEGGTYSESLKAAREARDAGKKLGASGATALAALGQTFPSDPQVQALVKTGYQPGMTMDAIKQVWESAQKRYDIGHAYHPPAASPGMWAHDTTTNTDVWVTREQALAAPGRFTKPPTAGAGGSGGGFGSLTPTAIQGMYDDLTRLNDEMKEYEDAHAGIGSISSVLGAGARQKHTDLKSAFAAGVSNAALGAFDPAYQKYITNNARAGNIISQINSKRGTEYQSLLDIEQSGQAPGDAGDVVASKQLVRANALAGRPKPPLGYVPRAPQPPGQPTPTPAADTTTPPPAPTGVSQMTDRQLWDAKARTPQGLKWLTDHHIARPPGP